MPDDDIDNYHDLTDPQKYVDRMHELSERAISPCKRCTDDCKGMFRCDKFKAWHTDTWKMLHN